MPPKVKAISSTQTQPRLAQQASATGDGTSPRGGSPEQETALSDSTGGVNKNELLSLIRSEITQNFKTEPRAALGDDLSSIKTELRDMKEELANNIASIKTDVTELKSTVGDMERSLSTCTDDITTVQQIGKLNVKIWSPGHVAITSGYWASARTQIILQRSQ